MTEFKICGGLEIWNIKYNFQKEKPCYFNDNLQEISADF